MMMDYRQDHLAAMAQTIQLFLDNGIQPETFLCTLGEVPAMLRAGASAMKRVAELQFEMDKNLLAFIKVSEAKDARIAELESENAALRAKGKQGIWKFEGEIE